MAQCRQRSCASSPAAGPHTCSSVSALMSAAVTTSSLPPSRPMACSRYPREGIGLLQQGVQGVRTRQPCGPTPARGPPRRQPGARMQRARTRATAPPFLSLRKYSGLMGLSMLSMPACRRRTWRSRWIEAADRTARPCRPRKKTALLCINPLTRVVVFVAEEGVRVHHPLLACGAQRRQGGARCVSASQQAPAGRTAARLRSAVHVDLLPSSPVGSSVWNTTGWE